MSKGIRIPRVWTIVAALPSDVRKGSALPIGGLYSGLRPGVGAQPHHLKMPHGKAEPFRTSGGIAVDGSHRKQLEIGNLTKVRPVLIVITDAFISRN